MIKHHHFRIGRCAGSKADDQRVVVFIHFVNFVKWCGILYASMKIMPSFPELQALQKCAIVQMEIRAWLHQYGKE